MAADGGGVIVQADPRTCRSAAADGAARRASARRTVLFFSLHVPFVGTLVHHRSPFPPNYPSLGCLAAEGRRGRGSLSALVVTSCAARPRQSMAAPSLSRSLPPPLPPPPVSPLLPSYPGDSALPTPPKLPVRRRDPPLPHDRRHRHSPTPPGHPAIDADAGGGRRGIQAAVGDGGCAGGGGGEGRAVVRPMAHALHVGLVIRNSRNREGRTKGMT